MPAGLQGLRLPLSIPALERPQAMQDTIAATASAAPETDLAALRAELDRIDDALHDALMRRAAVVERVAGLRGKVPLRPGREAAILRRLVARHAGRLPVQAVIRIWRELLAGTTAMQGPTLVSVCDDGQGAMIPLAREHFGALTPLHAHRTPAQAIREVSAGSASVAVLPLPAEGESGHAAWWTALLHKDERRIHVIARLPFWTPRPEGAPQAQALVVAAAPPDASGHDRSLIGFEIAPGSEPGQARRRPGRGGPGAASRSSCAARRGARPRMRWSRRTGFVPDGDHAPRRRSPPRARRSCSAPTQCRSKDPARHDREAAPRDPRRSTPTCPARPRSRAPTGCSSSPPTRARSACRPGRSRPCCARADELFRYPDGGAVALRRAIGARFGLDPERIVCGAGSDDLIYQLCLSYAGPGTEIVMSAHGFSMYEIAGPLCRRDGAQGARARPHRGCRCDARLRRPARRGSCSWPTPTTRRAPCCPRREVERLRAGLPPEVLLVLDSAYAEYVDRPDYEPGVKLVDAGDNTVMTRTFSKIFGMGGLRLGWCYAPPAVVDVLNRVRSPFNVNLAAQEAGIAALAEPGWVEKCRAHNMQWRAWLAAALTRAGVKVWPSEGNFVLADFATPARAEAADRFMQARGIIARGMKAYALPHCLRITVGTEEECRLVAEALGEFMATQTVDG